MKDAYVQACVATILACGFTAAAEPVPVESPDAPPVSVYKKRIEEPLNTLSLSYRMGLNLSVNFKQLGGFERIGNPGPNTGANFDRTYEQGGYNRVDSSDNAGGLTWFWGYGNAGAVEGDALLLQSSTSPADLEVEGEDEAIQHGFELSYGRRLLSGKYGKLGAEFGFSYMPLSVSDDSTLNGTVYRITDRYELSGVIPPVAPYTGTYEGPGPLIDSSPTRSRAILEEEATVYGKRSLEADVFIFRLGPRYDFPIKGKLYGSLFVGLTLAYANFELGYSETVVIGSVGSQTRGASDSESDFLVGGYAGGALSYTVMKNTDVFVGAYFQSAGKAVTDSGGAGYVEKEGVLDMRQSVVVSFGVSYSF
jgi:hypothetical protein